MRKRGYDASYTVEASYVMAMVIFSLAMLIRVSYSQCQAVTGNIKLHYIVYQLRRQESGEGQEFSAGKWSGYADRDRDSVVGSVSNGQFEREIEMPTYNPEELMRKMTILEELKKRYGFEARVDEEQIDG